MSLIASHAALHSKYTNVDCNKFWEKCGFEEIMNFFLSEGQHAKHPNNNIFKLTKIKHGITINNPSDNYLNMQVHIKLTEDNHYHLLKGMHAQQAEMQEIGERGPWKKFTLKSQ